MCVLCVRAWLYGCVLCCVPRKGLVNSFHNYVIDLVFRLILFIYLFVSDGDSDDVIISKLSGAVKQKKAALGGHTSANEIATHSASNRPMILIGG